MPRAGSVSLIGRPNAGKSTLLNLIIGTKVAIVSDKPQTTRNRILAVKHRDDGQLVFVDTPGIHRPLHRLNVRMVDAAVETLREMDVIALVFDASSRPGRGDEYVSNLLTHVTRPVVLVLNKIDLVAKSALLPLMARAAHLARLCRHRPRVRGDGRWRRPARARVAGSDAGRRCPLPG